MLTEKNLQELLDYKAQHPVLSLYLNTDPSQGNADNYRLHLRNMLKDVTLSEDIRAVEQYFAHQYDWSGRSVALFSCAPEGFLREFSLAIPVRSRLRVSDYPHVKPLADLFDAFGGYGVILVDKQGARVFSFHLGELLEQEGVLGENVKHVKHGGASSVPGRRGGVSGRTNENEIIERNMKEAADFAAHFFSENHIRRVLIGGSEENVALFRSLLPKTWQSLVIGTFSIGMTASKDEVLARAMQAGQEAERRREAHLIETVVTASAKGRNGVIKLEDTLHAVRDGRVQVLLIREGYRAPGYQCKGCSYLTTQKLATCSFCGGVFADIPDAVEMAVRTVLQQGGDVEVIHDGDLTKEFGDIAAFLRY